MGFSPRSKLYLPALAAGAVLLAVPAFAQEQGVSHPEALGDSIAATPVAGEHYKPSHAAPVAETYVPSPAAYSANATGTSPVAPPPTASLRARSSEPIAPTAPAAVVQRMPVEDEDSDMSHWSNGIVTEVPDTPGTLIDGTLFRARLQETLSTRETLDGARFSARLEDGILQHGQIIVPAGSLLRGRVTDVHGGKRIGGAATLRLTPETIEFPDGRQLRLSAQVAGLDDASSSRVNSEGVVIARTNGKATAAEFGLATAGGAAAGALLGAGVGAVVGAGVGAGVTTAAWLKREHQETLPAGTQVVFCLRHSLHVEDRDVALGR